ncbi:MAG: hypothetical protein OXT69_07195 [Candidatus Poribacteria bacterium]|nr:hypothetical protein [Candidatus Poribacteria bacterium]
MTTRRLATVLGCVAIVIVLAFGYAALKYRGAPAPEHKIIQSPVIQPTESAAPVSETPLAPPADAPPAHKEAGSSDAGIDEETQQTAPLDPERVAAAWEKVEHIRNNLDLYGTFHPEADEIIDQLLPLPPEELGVDEAEAQEILDLFERLIPLNDPRAAEPLVRWQTAGPANSGAWGDAMIALGAPCIPFLLEYADHDLMGTDVAIDLKKIVNRHPDLDPDIVTYILEPLFEKHKRWFKLRQEWGILPNGILEP